MDIIYYFIIFVLGVSGGWHLREWMAIRRVETILQTLEEVPHGEEVEDDRDDYVRLVVEKHSDVLYIYTEDNEFVGQGSTKEEIKEVIGRKLKGARLAVDEEGAKLLEALL